MVPAVGGAIVFFCSPGSGVHPELGKATNPQRMQDATRDPLK
jgi:hypothetical protein